MTVSRSPAIANPEGGHRFCRLPIDRTAADQGRSQPSSRWSQP